MKITKQELTRLLAEKVMGWKIDKNHGYYRDLPSASSVYACSVEDWNPLEDANHALQVLEAWVDCGVDYKARKYTIDRYVCPKDGKQFMCTLYEFISNRYGYCEPAWVQNHNLNHAICLAVAEAITGNKYELED